MIKMLVSSAVSVVVFFAFAACGSSSETSSSFTCCYNSVFYDCKTQEEFATCTKPDTKCVRNPDGDAKCKK